MQTTISFGESVRQIHARPTVRGSMPVIGDGGDILVHVGIEVLSALTMIDPAGNHVP